MSEGTMLRTDYDVVVVGARCAGAATAMLLARQGLRVLAVERTRYGSDTLSTHALMRGAVLQLHRWGVLEAVAVAGTPPIRRTSFHYLDEEISVPIKARAGVDALYAPRRTVLDAVLQDAAQEAGATLVHGARVNDLLRDRHGRVCGVALERPVGGVSRVGARMVVGADGVRSTVARLVGAETVHAGVHATGNVYGYWRGLGLEEGTHWYWAPGVGAGAIPTNHGETCVFAGMPVQRFRGEVRSDLEGAYLRILLECSPVLAAAVAGAEAAGELKAFAGVEGFLRHSWGPGWALVGDAGYFKDPITAHGISDALRDAELLARAVADGTEAALARYQAERDELSVGLLEITDAVASFDWTLDEVRQLHLDLSTEMNREVEAILELDWPAPPAVAELARSA